MKRAAREAGVRKHLFEFGECVSVARGRADQHDQAKTRGVRRRHAIVIWYKLQRCCPAAICECGVNFSQESFISRRIKVMKKVRQQHQVIAAAEVDIKSAAFDRVISIGDTGRLRILFRDLEHRFPLERGDFSLRVVRGKRDPE